MKFRASVRHALAAFLVLAVVAPVAAFADGDGDDDRNTSYRERHLRVLYAVDDGGKLLRFRASSPGSVSGQPITGLPAGVSLTGIDFRPATGDLYALGNDRVVYRVNIQTAIAVAEGPAFVTAPPLAGTKIGFDFNPTVDKIRVTTDADENLRLNPDEGNTLAVDTKLTPAEVTVVGSAYTNSSFVAFPGRPATTTLYDIDIAASPDRLWTQSPANAGTLIDPKPLGFNLGSSLGFDIVAVDNVGYVAGTPQGATGARLYRIDVATGTTRDLGRIGGGAVTVAGLAAWQD